MATLGALLRIRRARLGMSQEALAEAVGVAARSVNRWEHDEAQPHPKHRNRLAQVLGVPPGALSAGDATSLWHVPLRRNPFFTGREAILQRIREELTPTGSWTRVL